MTYSNEVSVRNRVNIKLDGINESATFISFNGLNDDKEHIAITFGDWNLKNNIPLVRLHSECLTGDA